MQQEPVLKHKRDVQRQIMMPVLFPIILLIVMALVLFGLAMTDNLSGQQIGVVAGILVTLFVLLPMALIMLVFTALMLLLAFGSNNIYLWIRTPIRLMRQYTERGAAITRSTAAQIGKPVINARTRFERVSTGVVNFIGVDDDEQQSTR